MSGHARGGNDRLDGSEGFDILTGDALGLSDRAQGGNDRIDGDKERAILVGDVWGMSGRARGGDDHLDGGESDDDLIGDGDLTDRARGGDDRIDGGEGNDWLYGDANPLDIDVPGVQGGADLFVFAPGSDLDTILDFERGKDRLDVRDYGITAAQLGQYLRLANVVDFDRTAADVDGVEVYAAVSSEDGFVPAALSVSDFIFAA